MKGIAVVGSKLRWLAMSGVALATAVTALVAWLTVRVPPLTLNKAQARSMLPAIDAYLDQHASSALSGFGYLDARLKPRILCDAGLIEIRPDGSRWLAGMVINCGEFARRGRTLIEGASGYPGIGEVMTLSREQGCYRVLSLRVGPPYWDQDWVDSHFSPAAAAKVLGAPPPTAPDPITRAWRVLGFQPGTRVLQQP